MLGHRLQEKYFCKSRPNKSLFSEILQARPSNVVRSNSLMPPFSNQEEITMARRVQESLRPRRPELR